MFYLENQLNYLLKKFSKLNTNESSILYNDLKKILDNLRNDLFTFNLKTDELISIYILNTKKYEKKNLNQILNEIQNNINMVQNYDYLYLIALNKFNELLEKNENDNFQFYDNNKKTNSDIINKSRNNVNNTINNNINIITKEKKALIEREELILNIKSITPNILDLKYEENPKYEDKYDEFIDMNFIQSRIFNIKNDNINNILIFNEIFKQMEQSYITNRNNFYMEQKNKFISSIENLNSIDYKKFYEVISNKKFQDEIIDILKSKSIVEYLINNNDYDETKKEYKNLMEKLNDSLFFIDLFRLKYLPFGIKAVVNYNLKIIVNPLYYKFNEYVNENNKIIIFKADLKILIIHEIMNILKYMKNEVEVENEKKLINYLFGISNIKSINLEEAKKINDINNWNDVNILKNIFINENQAIENKSFDEKVDYLDIYFTDDDNEDYNYKKVKKYEDIGIDID